MFPSSSFVRPSHLTLFLWLTVSSSSLWSTVHSEQQEDDPPAFQCNICGPGLQIGTVDAFVSPDGRQNRTCGELQTFGDDGFISEPQCLELNSFVQDACDCQPFVCSICGRDGITNQPGGVLDIPFDNEGLTTCAAVQAVADLGGFNESFCDVVQSLALEPCGCQLTTDEEGGGGTGGNHSSPTRTPGGPPTEPTTSSGIPTPAPQDSGSPQPPPSAAAATPVGRIGTITSYILLLGLLGMFVYGESLPPPLY